MDEYRDLAERAQEIRAQLDAQPRDPFVVEFAGTPKSGKSTSIDGVAHFFRRLGFRVHAPSEGASRRTPAFLKDDLTAFNTWSACYALSQILEASHDPARWQLAILDRGLFDSLVWFDLLTEERAIPEVARSTIQEFLLLEKWRSKTNLVVLFTADPETAMRRENRGKLIEHVGRAMNPDFLERLNGAYGRVAEQYGDRFENFVTLDTSDDADVTEQQAAATVVEYILGIIELDVESTS